MPDASAVFTGDILFIEGTPIVWAGPISNWIAACDLIEALDPTHIVPGHGPLTDLSGVRVSLYFPGDRAKADRVINNLFAVAETKKFPVQSKQPSYNKRFSGYWAGLLQRND